MKKVLLLLMAFLPLFAWADDIAYAVFKDGTLTFKYGAFTPDGETSWDVSDTGTQQFYPQELSWGGQLKHVVFDASFAQARPKSCFAWFDACKNLEDIKGLEYLNTSEVTNMAWMFEACPKLTSLDLTHFDTSNVTDMGNMFAGAAGLTSLDLSSFNTAKVTNMTYMFAGLSSAPNQFKTIYVEDGWTVANVTTSDKMFDYCNSLVGGRGTAYNSEHNDKTYACIDAVDSPGYLSRKSDPGLPPGTYHVATAGTLSTLISEADRYTLKELTLTGELNGSDLCVVRDMVGCNDHGWTTQGKVTKLDLSGARIVAGGDRYLDTQEISCSTGDRTTNSSGFIYSTEDDVLGSYLFAGCDKLEEVKLPNSITRIGDNVFHFGYGLKSLTIPKNVTVLGNAVLIFCDHVESLSVDPENTVFSSPAGSNAILKGTTLVMGCNTTAIPDNVTVIGQGAFYGVGQWGTTLTLPSKVTTIESNAFACSHYSGFVLPEGLQTIREYAFGWTPVEKIVIPASVTKIETRAYYGCMNIGSITVNADNAIYDSRDNCNAIIEKASNTLIQGCCNTEIPQTVKVIGPSAYEQLGNLDLITIPYWITSIGDRAFADCWTLKEVTSEIRNPAGVTMGQGVFSTYQSTKPVLYVPKGTKSAYEAISEWADGFSEIREKESGSSSAVRTINVETAGTLSSFISEGEKYIIEELTLTGELNGSDFRLLRDMAGNDYQGNLTNGKLERLDLSGVKIVSGGDYYINTTTIHWTENMQMVMGSPMQYNTVENQLGDYLFAGCKSLVTISLPNGITEIGSSVFSHNPKLRSLLIPKSVSSISIGFIQECDDLAELSVESGNQTYSSPAGSNAIIRTADSELVAGCINTSIPAGTKSIAPYAFQHCKTLSTIEIPEGLTKIGDFAFWGCEGLTALSIPASVTKIGYMAFYACSALNSIAVDAANTVYDSHNNCNALIETASKTLLQGCKNTVIPNDILIIEENALRACFELTSIEIPASVVEIRDNAFAYCYQLKEVISNITDPSQVKMGVTVFDWIPEDAVLKVPQGTKASYLAADGWKDAFAENNIQEMGGQDSDPSAIHVATAGTLSTLIPDDKKLTIEELTITGNLNGTDFRLIREMAGNDYLGQPTKGMLKKLDLSGANIVEGGEKYLDTDRITSSSGTYTQYVGENSFHYATENNKLGNSVFAGCDMLKEVVLPTSITAIGDYVFWYCLNLESLTIPKNVTSIGWAFIYGPNKLTSLSVAEGNPVYSSPAGSNAIMQGTKLVFGISTTKIPQGTTIIGNSAFSECSGLGDVILPEGVTTIECGAFAWSGLTGITMPSTLTTIDNDAFAGCYNLTSFTLPKTVTLYGYGLGALKDCQNLTTIKVEDGNPIYDSRENCNAIIETKTNTLVSGCQNTVIPKDVTILGEQAFRGMPLSDYVIPNWITSIGLRAFWNAIMTSVTIPSSVKSIGEFAFAYCYFLKTVTVESKTPIAISEKTFTERANIDLVVPAGFADAYKAADFWKEFKSITEAPLPQTETINIGASGKASYCGDYSLDFSFSEEVKAYIATGYDAGAGTIWLTRVKDVPAGTPILIKGKANTPYNVPVISSKNSYYENMFKGNTSGETIKVDETEGDLVNYYLSGKDGTFKSVNKSVNIGNNKSYLQLPGTFAPAAEGDAQKVSIGTTGKASYAAPVDLDFTDVAGLKAFTATGYDKNGTIWLTRVMKVQKGEGLLLKGDKDKEYTIPSVAVQSSYKNMFVGNISGDKISVGEKSEDGFWTYYYLSGKDGTFKSVNKSVNINTNKSYLRLPTSMLSSAVGTRSIDDCLLEEQEVIAIPVVIRRLDSATGIDVQSSIFIFQSKDAYYNLQGQRVENPGKGLYIKNGKKVIMK